MIRFRNFLICSIAVALCGMFSNQVIAQGFDDLSLVQYDKQLNAILLTTLEEEKKFIADVVKLVGEEKLPKKLVDTSFQWVRNRRPNTKYPFIYFERVLRLQANKLKLPVPPFDYDIYNQRRPRR